jgi:hypothetical protein
MARFSRISPIHLALGLVILFELGLFADSHYQRWHRVIVPLNQAPEHAGEGLVIRGDGLGYYAWLRSLLIDGDWDFSNEFDKHPVSGDWVPPPIYRTEIGRRANQWSVGPACIWALFVVPGHCILRASGEPYPADGYSLPYQMLVAAASLTMSALGLFLLYGICRHYARPSRAALAAALMTLGSTLVYYNSVEVSIAHGLGAVALSAFLYYWLKTYNSLRWSRWFVVGLLVGAAALVRWQLATFAVLPFAEALLSAWRACPRRSTVLQSVPQESAPESAPHATADRQSVLQPVTQRCALLLLAAGGAFLGFLPQLIAWHCVYGHWLAGPPQEIAYHWLRPSFSDLLLSQDRSFFYWTPMTVLGFLGLIACRRTPARAVPTPLLLAGFALQVYALGSVWGNARYLPEMGRFTGGACLGRAYGMRHLTEAVVILAPGLAVLLERADTIAPRWLGHLSPFRLLCASGLCLALWNLNLVLAYNDSVLPTAAGLAPDALLHTTYEVLRADPWTFLLLGEALGLFFLVLLCRNDDLKV